MIRNLFTNIGLSLFNLYYVFAAQIANKMPPYCCIYLNNAALYPSLIYIFHFAKEKTTFIHFFYALFYLNLPKDVLELHNVIKDLAYFRGLFHLLPSLILL